MQQLFPDLIFRDFEMFFFEKHVGEIKAWHKKLKIVFFMFHEIDGKALFIVSELCLWTGYTYRLIRKHSVLGENPMVSLWESRVTVNMIT